jgi:hypothetical protein
VVVGAGTQQAAFGRSYLALQQAPRAPNPATPTPAPPTLQPQK